MESIDDLKEAIGDHGIDIALDCCVDLIREGYLNSTHTEYDRRFLIRFLNNIRTKVQLFEIRELTPEEQ